MQSLRPANEKEDFEVSNPVYVNGKKAEVGHFVSTNIGMKEIIRIDSNTRQVWFKTGGFEWFENMKKYRGYSYEKVD